MAFLLVPRMKLSLRPFILVGGVRFKDLEEVKKIPYGPAGGIIGKKKLKKWEGWLAVEEWACAGTVRIGCWNLEGVRANFFLLINIT